MTHTLHKLVQHRNYHRHEKWGVFAGLALLTLVVWSTQNIWLEHAPASAATLYVKDISAPATVSINKLGGDLAVISLVDKRTNQPAKGVWIGLRIADETKRTPEFTYYDWYSPHAQRSFYPADDHGLVYFPMESKIVGKIDYDIYVGNAGMKTAAKYQSLGRSFEVEYK